MIETENFQGNVDFINSSKVVGWAWDKTKPNKHIGVEIYDNNRFVTKIQANLFGSDLHNAGIGNGEHRWSFNLKDITKDGNIHKISIRFGDSDKELTGSPSVISGNIEKLIKDIDIREVLSYRYIIGEGIEIGALNNPLQVSTDVRTRYVDRMDEYTLTQHYPEMKNYNLVHVDIVTDGEKLEKVKNESQNFVIANHFLEHCQDPITTLNNMFRVLTNEGIIYLTIPNKRSTLDNGRPTTPIEHLITDYEQGPETSRKSHYEQWVEHIRKIDPKSKEFNKLVNKLMDENYSIHFHVFNELTIAEFLIMLRRKYDLPFVLETIVNNMSQEVIFILRKTTNYLE